MEGRIRPSGLTEVTSRVDALSPHQPTPHHKESSPIPFKIAAPIIIATLGLAACGPISAKTSTPEGAFPTSAPTSEVIPANPTATVVPAETPTSAPTKVPEVVAPDVVDYMVDQSFIDAQYGYRYALSGNILSPMDNVPLEDANAAQWILNAENNAQLVKERTGAAPSATLLFTNGKKDAESRNAAMSFSGNSIMWPSYSEGQSTFLSASPSEYWFPVQADQNKVTYKKVNLPTGYTSDDVRMGWVGDNQSVELAAKGGKGMLVFNPTTQEWREMKNVPTTELLTNVITPFVHAFGDKVNVAGTEIDGTQLLAEIQKNPDAFIQKKTIKGQEYSFLIIDGIPLAFEGSEGVWAEISLKFLGELNNIVIGSDTRGVVEDLAWHKILSANFARATIEPGIDWFASEPVRGQIDPESVKNVNDQIAILQKDGITDLVGHPIIDNGGAPDWIKNGTFTQEELRQIMTDRIEHIISSNQEINTWVVVNEPYLPANINPDRSKDPFYKVWGNYDYIIEAFQIARNEAKKEGRDIKLIYNDGDNHYADGQSSAITRQIVKRLVEQHLVDYVGMQMHIGEWEANAFEKYMVPEMPAEFKYYKDLGIPILITEMTYYPSIEAKALDKKAFDEREAFVFAKTIELALESGDVEGITFWGMTDFYNVKDSPDYTMFDEEARPKEVFYKVFQTLFDYATK